MAKPTKFSKLICLLYEFSGKKKLQSVFMEDFLDSCTSESFANLYVVFSGFKKSPYKIDASVLDEIKKAASKDEITEFFVYPNPVRGGHAKARFEIGAAAKTATFEIYDITGLCVFKEKMCFPRVQKEPL